MTQTKATHQPQLEPISQFIEEAIYHYDMRQTPAQDFMSAAFLLHLERLIPFPELCDVLTTAASILAAAHDVNPEKREKAYLEKRRNQVFLLRNYIQSLMRMRVTERPKATV